MKTNTNGGGVIINVSSIHGEKSNEYMGAYAASKAALDSLTRTMAIEFAPHNVRVNAIAPGVVPVERTAQAFQDPAIRGAWEERIPLGRVGTVEQVAQACIPLIENEWITGSILQIDGGMMARANMPVRARPSPET
jgi:glucose 1-dehydrogenase